MTPLSPAIGRRPDPVLRHTDAERPPAGDFAAGGVPNARLRGDMVPARSASWHEIEEFALAYDGYAYWSDVAELALRGIRAWARDRTLPSSLDELRGCLFYEQRRWHHFGEEPHGRATEYVWALLDAVRSSVSRPPEHPAAMAPASAGPTLVRAPTPAPARLAAVVASFADDDAGYLAWVAANGDGFVLNAAKGASVKGLKLHRAACSSILSSAGSTRSLTSSCRKVCASDASALLEWCADNFATDPDPCLRCRP